jgi:hypothetical protein
MKLHATQVRFDKNVLTSKGLQDRIIDTEIEAGAFGISVQDSDLQHRILYPWSVVAWIKYETPADEKEARGQRK